MSLQINNRFDGTALRLAVNELYELANQGIRPEEQEDYLKELALRILVVAAILDRDDQGKGMASRLAHKALSRVLKDARNHLEVHPEKYTEGDAYFEFCKTRFWNVAVKIEDLFSRKIKGHFYHIEDSEGKIKGYLFGTIHCIHHSILSMNKNINQAIAKSDHLFLEIKEFPTKTDPRVRNQKRQLLENLPEEQLKQALQAYVKILRGYSLVNTTWIEFEEKLASLSPIDALKLCFEQYDYAFAKEKGVLDNSNHFLLTIDDWLHQQFTKDNKPVFGFESQEEMNEYTYETFIANFADPEYQREWLTNLLEPNLEDAVLSELTSLEEWKQGNIDVSEEHQEGTLEYKICEKRNEIFGDSIYQDILSDKGIGFYGFGLDHLYGENGVIKNLQKRNLDIIRK